MAGRGEQKASKRMIEAKERQVKALEAKKAGLNYEQIAEKLGYADASGAFRAVEKALQEMIREPAEHVRMLELARLDQLWMAYYRTAVEGKAPQVVDRLLKIMERRAKLLGLDAPMVVKWQEELEKAGLPASVIFERLVAQYMAEQAGGDE